MTQKKKLIHKHSSRFSVPILAPSVLSANFSKLSQEILEVEKLAGKSNQNRTWIHWDVMDGHFVPNLTFGPMLVKALRSASKLYFDCHLMVSHPEEWISQFVEAGAQNITIHAEATHHLDRCIQLIKEKNCHVGVAINPATSVSFIEPILQNVDLVLVMTVNPGFGGQKFISYTIEKILELAKVKEQRQLNFKIQVDGGISDQNIQQLRAAGADCFVAGTSVFGAKSRKSAVQKLFNLMDL